MNGLVWEHQFVKIVKIVKIGVFGRHGGVSRMDSGSLMQVKGSGEFNIAARRIMVSTFEQNRI